MSILRHLLPKAIFLKVHFVIKIFWFLTHPDTFQKTQLAWSLSLICSGRKNDISCVSSDTQQVWNEREMNVKWMWNECEMNMKWMLCEMNVV